jgi:hypothetical protein
MKWNGRATVNHKLEEIWKITTEVHVNALFQHWTGGVRKIMKCHRKDIGSPGWESNHRPPEFQTGAITSQKLRLVRESSGHSPAYRNEFTRFWKPILVLPWEMNYLWKMGFGMTNLTHTHTHTHTHKTCKLWDKIHSVSTQRSNPKWLIFLCYLTTLI